MGKNIVITGEGIVSAIGNDKDSVLNSLRSNKTGIGEMKYLKSSHQELPVGEVKLSNEEMKAMLGYGASELISRTTMMGMLAVGQAIEEAKLARQQGLRIVLVNGTTVGGMDITEQYFETFTESDKYIGCLKAHDCGSCTQMIAERFDMFDDSTTISTACSSAANALILGANLIKAGEADIVVAGNNENGNARFTLKIGKFLSHFSVRLVFAVFGYIAGHKHIGAAILLCLLQIMLRDLESPVNKGTCLFHLTVGCFKIVCPRRTVDIIKLVCKVVGVGENGKCCGCCCRLCPENRHGNSQQSDCHQDAQRFEKL